jgi:hypothetical protein
MGKVLLITSIMAVCCSGEWLMAQDVPPQQEQKAKVFVPPQISSAEVDGEKEAGEKGDEIPKVTKERPMDFWMKHKLEYSKTILESLTLGDYQKLASTARRMQVLGKIEGFVRRGNPAYRAQAKVFELANGELIRHAENKDAHGATIAFNQLATSCVVCHQILRENTY